MSKSNNHKLFFLMILTFLYFATEWSWMAAEGFPVVSLYISNILFCQVPKVKKFQLFFLKTFDFGFEILTKESKLLIVRRKRKRNEVVNNLLISCV